MILYMATIFIHRHSAQALGAHISYCTWSLQFLGCTWLHLAMWCISLRWESNKKKIKENKNTSQKHNMIEEINKYSVQSL